jgi:hypothetical protein
MTNDFDDDDGPRGSRSPRYPSIDLAEAVNRAGMLHKHSLTHEARVSVAMAAIGYSPKSGPGSSVLGALLRFGLVEARGRGDNRMVRVTEIGRRIVLGREDSPERRRLLKEAALSPPIHQDLWERYGSNTPSDSLMMDYLLIERRFTSAAAQELLKEYKATLAFADLVGDTDNDTNEGEPDEGTVEMTTVTTEAQQATKTGATGGVQDQPGARTFIVPLSQKAEARLQVPRELDEAGWKLMMAVLDAMKPGIVSAPEVAPEEPSTDPGSPD